MISPHIVIWLEDICAAAIVVDISTVAEPMLLVVWGDEQLAHAGALPLDAVIVVDARDNGPALRASSRDVVYTP